MERWEPEQAVTRQEQFILKRLEKRRKLFGFLRRHRHEIFDDKFQAELESMYRDTGAGKDPVPPAQLAMALLLQGYVGLSDFDAVEATVLDLRWQMVLDCLGATEPPFSQGALQGFRERLIAHDMDRRLLERTVELAKRTEEFDWKKLPKTLRVAIDSAPLEGAGRVEDTINLLGHAGRKVVECAAGMLDWSMERVCLEAGAPLLAESSVKKALDLDWSDPAQKASAARVLAMQLANLQDWIATNLKQELKKPPLKDEIESLAQLIDQDLEPDPDGGGDEDSGRRRSGPPRLRRGQGDAARPQEQVEAVQRVQAAHRDRPGLRPHSLRGDHAGEPTRGRGRSRPGRRHREAGAQDRRPLHRPRLREGGARRRSAGPRRRDRLHVPGSRGARGLSPRPRSRSTCATSPSPAQQARWSRSSSAP